MSFLLALSALLWEQVGAVSVNGAVAGQAAPDTRLSAWAVTPFGQPVAELASVPLKGNTFALPIPDDAPPARAQVPVDNRLSWPGLIDFEKASAPAQSAELKLFTYRDLNGDGKRQDTEPLREVRAQAGKGELFMVWASTPVTVTASRNYRAELQKGWNVLQVNVRGVVSVAPVDAKAPITLNLGQ